jgi:hypothetical protein
VLSNLECKNHHFAKTGSGQTWEKLRDKGQRFVQADPMQWHPWFDQVQSEYLLLLH